MMDNTDPGRSCHKVVPLFTIAKLVNITPVSLWFIGDISLRHHLAGDLFLKKKQHTPRGE